MALTQISIHKIAKGSHIPFLEAEVHFGVECVVDKSEVVDFYNIFLIWAGKASISIDFQTKILEGPALFFTGPGQVFSILSEQQIEGTRIAFNQAFYCEETFNHQIGCNGFLFNDLIDSAVIPLNKRESSEIQEIISLLQKNMSLAVLVKEELVRSYLKAILITAINVKKRKFSTGPRKERVHDELRSFNLLVERHFKDWHQVNKYAQQLNISPRALSRRLARYGKRPSEVIAQRLLTEAKRLLLFSEMSGKEICFELGFSDPAYFTRFFKKHMDISPSGYRETRHNPQAV